MEVKVEVKGAVEILDRFLETLCWKVNNWKKTQRKQETESNLWSGRQQDESMAPFAPWLDFHDYVIISGKREFADKDQKIMHRGLAKSTPPHKSWVFSSW